MVTKLNRDAYERLVAEDLSWLMKVPRTLERDHVIEIVRRSPEQEYGRGKGANPPVKEMPAASELFFDAFQGGGTLVADCDFCGRTYFEDDSTSGGWSEGELERLQERAKKHPEDVLGVESVHITQIDGMTYVYGCECNGVAKFEQFIWNHRFQIAEYLKSRVLRWKAQVDEEVEKLVVGEADMEVTSEEPRCFHVFVIESKVPGEPLTCSKCGAKQREVEGGGG